MPVGGQAVVILGGGQLDGLQTGLGAGAADYKGQMIGRAGGGADGFHFVRQKRLQFLRVEQRLGFLEQIGLVGAAAALGYKEELVFAALGGIEVDLGGQVGAGVTSR